MSVENVISFSEKVVGQPQLEVKVRACIEGNLNLPALVALGAEHGFTFTEDEVWSIYANDNDELSDFELEMVAAGNPVNCNDGAQHV